VKRIARLSATLAAGMAMPAMAASPSVLRAQALSGQVAASIGRGAAAPSRATPPPAAAPVAQAGPAAPVTINIYAAANQRPQDIAAEVKRVLEEERRRPRGPGSGASFADAPDWGDA
jgi:hypothetical protein